MLKMKITMKKISAPAALADLLHDVPDLLAQALVLPSHLGVGRVTMIFFSKEKQSRRRGCNQILDSLTRISDFILDVSTKF